PVSSFVIRASNFRALHTLHTPHSTLPMHFSDFIVPSALIPNLKAADKPAVIEELVAALCNTGAVDEEYHEEIVATLLRREEFGSTGLGNGFAFPHARHEAISRSMGTVGIHR